MFVFYYGGGLGNKMFEYAVAVAMHMDYPDVPIKFFDTLKDVVWYKSVEINEVFCTTLQTEEISNSQFRQITGRFAPFRFFRYLNPSNRKDYTNLWYKLDAKLNENSEARKHGVIINRGFYYIPMPELKRDCDYFFDGPWVNYRYFDKYRSLIQKEFTFRHIYENDRIQQLQNCNSVAVHVRRGDHVTVSQKARKIYNCDLCDVEYYKRAMAIMAEKVSNPVFYFFSDDHSYIESNFKEIRNKRYIRSKRDYFDLQLMSLCKHAIIANSTFSFWGAYLNRNENKVIVAPKYYEIRYGKRVEMEYPKEWISIEV